uniref:oligosaccharide flippase family protein n=1 Tax=Pararhizobium sp. IMCC3301 TaxID=3067904 RepID=UPI00274105C1|nr:oligosaccharide flippase family protein [Pararhizobium sp. IMCC3301]
MIEKLVKFLSSLFATSFLLTLARLAGAGTGIILQILIARYYGAGVLGTYYLALSLAGILSIFMSMGYPWILAPIVAASEMEKPATVLSDFLKLVRKDALLLSVVFAVPAALLIWLYPGAALDQRLALLIGVATAPVYTAMRVCGSLANAMKFFRLANLPELLVRPVLTLVFVAAAIALAVQLNAVSIVAINFFIALALTIWMAFFLSRNAGLGFAARSDGGQLSARETSKLRRLAVPMIFSTLFVNMFADVDILMIGLILPAGEAGIFGVAMKIAALLVFAVQITHQILLRDASNAHLAADRQQMHQIMRKANLFTIGSSVASFVLMVLFGRFLLGLFGTEFQAAYFALLGLILAQIIRAAAGPAIQILMITENQRTGIPVYICSGIVLLLSNLLLVPTYKYEGAAAAVIITTLFWSLWLNHLVRRKTGYQVSVFR